MGTELKKVALIPQ